MTPVLDQADFAVEADDLVESVDRPRDAAGLARAASRRRARAVRAATIATALGGLGGFLAISRTVQSARANRLDRALMRLARRGRSAWLNGAMRDVTSLGGPVLVTLAATAAVALSRRSRSAMLQVGLGSLGGVAAELALKKVFARPRPSSDHRLQQVSSYSYPSGHAIATSCLYLTLAFVGTRTRRTEPVRYVAFGTATAMTSLVAASRVYLGVHYPTDVLGGMALGTAWACSLEAIFDALGARALSRHGQRPAPVQTGGSM